MDDKQLLNGLFYRLKNIKEAEGILQADPAKFEAESATNETHK